MCWCAVKKLLTHSLTHSLVVWRATTREDSSRESWSSLPRKRRASSENSLVVARTASSSLPGHHLDVVVDMSSRAARSLTSPYDIHYIALERCNPWPHVANRHISMSQLLSLWRHSHYDVIFIMTSLAPRPPLRTYVRTNVRTPYRV